MNASKTKTKFFPHLASLYRNVFVREMLDIICIGDHCVFIEEVEIGRTEECPLHFAL